MTFFLAIIAGAVQGLTEFLPISSTGHLIIFEKIFNISQADFGLAFDASLHLGTLLAVAFFFSKDYLSIFKKRNSLVLKLIIGTIPAVILGLVFENVIESTLRQLWIVGLSMLIFSLVLVLAEVLGKKIKSSENLSFKESLIIGIFQAIALVPGISRSGSTISAGLFLGLKREEAAKFAFMLSGPIIAGAGLKKFYDVSTSGVSLSDMQFFAVGIISSFIFGYLTIKYLLKYLSKNSLYPFVIYRVVVGIVLLVTSN